MSQRKKIVLAITGATGAIYGVELLKALRNAGVEIHLMISPWAEVTLAEETDYSLQEVKQMADHFHAAGDLAAGPASGSFVHHGMVVAPCSMKTLAAISHGLADNLISRSADVCIKEKRPLILLVRETPLSAIHLENMLRLARLGVTIMPPVPSFYHRPVHISDLISQTTGRVLDMLGLENMLVKRWQQT
ncbi:MAG: UbiX family flavin prenyltransferase [Bacillota bacterium]|uniref:UbiX family flavin prenyltransferase n=1 Tax=Desulfurispora thermophila TaxID=265470 RepID=UPI00035D520D|nr:UbiX family flavin prenyltransferase [Desulfurispora thermophila]